MDDPDGQRERAWRREQERTPSQRPQIPRPQYRTSRPPIQLSSPPRAHQYQRSRPSDPYGRQSNYGHHDRSTNGSETSYTSVHQTTHSRRQTADHQPPPVSYQPMARHTPHISALSSSQAGYDSRPISEIGSPTFPIHTNAVPTRVDEEEEEEHQTPYEPVVHSREQSRDRRLKTTTTPTKARKNNVPIRDSETLPATDQAATMAALTAAIRQGLGPTAASSRSATPKPFSEVASVRMPFQGEPSSPSSVYTDTTANNMRHSIPLSSYQGYDPRDSKPSTIVEQEMSDYEHNGYAQDMPTPMSTHPIMQSGVNAMDSKIPTNNRNQLRLDIGAVREAEARGSMTSLSDLIKRATRLASNLDRGRTASRLGHLDMFGGSSDKLGNYPRNSTYSDVLNAFPPPADATNTDRPTTMWPNGEKQYMASKSSLGRFIDSNNANEQTKAPVKRRCCGMSPPVFVLVLLIVFLLIAAAVLVPVFLIVLPRMRHNSVNLAQCPSSHPCHNGGISVSTGTACSCICVDGFTGSDCSTESDPECVTSSMADGGTTYTNVTIGSSVLAFISGEQPSFGIPLNTTKLLSQFAYNNLSCASENSLVDFGMNQSSTQVKRFIMLPGMMSTEPHLPALNLPPSETKHKPRFVIVEGLTDAEEELHLLPTNTLQARQDATQSANGIVFATSSDAVSSPTATATATGTGSGSGSPTTSAASQPSQTAKVNVTDKQLGFAAVVVLYVLQTSADISVAVAANQAVLAYIHGSTSSSTIQVISGKDGMQADLDNYHIKFANGTTIGKD